MQASLALPARRRAALFTTGAITIGLELVSSRILTPYFGSSLYVWTGILTITLAALALGYRHGGRLARDSDAPGRDFTRCLIAAAISLLVGRWMASLTVPLLAEVSILGGSFAAAFILLGPALFFCSALNPLLVCLENEGEVAGDGGSGAVFALSTAGSIMGALVTAFVLLPSIDTPSILLVFSAACLVLAAATFPSPIRDDLPMARRWIAALLFLVLVAVFDRPPNQAVFSNGTYERLETYRTGQSQVSIVKVTKATGATRTVYAENGGLESTIDAQGRPDSYYFYIADAVLARLQPQAKRVLVLGLAGGNLPTLFARRGIEVDAVDINPDAATIARNWFGMKSPLIHVRTADARVALRQCSGAGAYDAILFDLFSGLDPIQHAATWEAFWQASGCMRPGGLIFANVGALRSDSANVEAIAAGMHRATRSPVWGYWMDPTPGFPLGNIVMASGGVDPGMPRDIYPSEEAAHLFGPVSLAVPAHRLDDRAKPLSDRNARGDLLFASDQIALRQAFEQILPVGW